MLVAAPPQGQTPVVISFVIPARDESPHVLRATVDGLRSTTPSAEREIVVVDDASLEPVGPLGRGVELVRNAVPAGVSRARRQAADLTTGEVLVCLDAHMSFDADWLTLMLEYVESGALLCAAYCDYDRREVGCYGADFRWCAERDHAAGTSPGFGPRHRLHDPGPGAHEVPMLLGACYMMLRSSYLALGGFSPLFRVWGADEQDLSARAWIAGLGVRCVADARVGHLTRSVAPYPVYFDHLDYNQIVFIRTVFERRTVEALLPSFAPIDGPVRAWLEAAGLGAWRQVVQRARKLTDTQFFDRVVPDLVLPDQGGPHIRH